MTDDVRGLAREIARLSEELRRVKRGMRASQLAWSSVDNGTLDLTQDGQFRGSVGTQFDGTTALNVVNGPPPPTPTQPAAAPAVGGARVVWDGLWLAGAVAPMDFKSVEIHASQTSDFDPSTAETLKTTFTTERGGEKLVSIPTGGTWYIRLIAVSLSGKKSAPSPQAEVVPVTVDDIGGTTIHYDTQDPMVTDPNLQPAVGDLWFKEVDPGPPPQYETRRWDGAAWTMVQDQGIGQALAEALAAQQAADQASADALAAQAAVDGKTTAYYQETAPATANENDLWVRTSDKRLHVYTSGTWVESQDQDVSNALDQAGTAQATADSKVRIFAQATEPTGMTAGDVGDLWFDTDDSNRMRTWDGAAWVDRQLGNTAIQPQSLVASDVIATGTVSAALLESLMVLTNVLIVGNPSNAHVEIGSTGTQYAGITLYDTDGNTPTFVADANTGDVFGAGTFQSPDYVEASQGWRIAPGGDVEFQRANIVGDLAADQVSATSLFVAGVPFDDHFPDTTVLPRGPIAVETLPQDISGLGSTSGQGIARIVLQAEQGRWYRVVWNAQRAELSATDATTFIFNISFTYDGSLATVDSELLQYQYVSNTQNRNRGMYMERVFRILGGSAMRLNLLFWVQRAAGTATLKLYSGGSSFVVEDLGANVDTPQVLSTDFRTGTTDPGSGSTAPATKEYVKDYYATWVRSWNSDGSVHSDEDAYQGEYPGYGGNRRSLIGFDDAQIRADLSGAEVLGCDVYLRNRHTYSAAGGTAVIGTHNHSSKPASWTGTITTNQWQKAHSKGAWLSQVLGSAVGNQFKDGTRRGIAIGPAPSTDVSWYGYYYGTGSNRPYLKIRYRK